ncbi:hypothetical protein RAB80_015429 [Fusarium oxysporum f. sp. vasinfectum]|nr:hypothetical protein RAB80_015429 [Fusarium oxysporum f. sp. vasinfectum]
MSQPVEGCVNEAYLTSRFRDDTYVGAIGAEKKVWSNQKVVAVLSL